MAAKKERYWSFSAWLGDPALRACSVPARGMWIDLLAYCAAGKPYGHLTINGAAPSVPTIARLIGCTPAEAAAWGRELEANGVFSRTEDGTIYCRRMVRESAPPAKRTPGRPRNESGGSRLPANWQPSESDAAYARARGLDVKRTVEDFRGYWLARPGEMAKKLDWSLTWQGWCRREADRQGTQAAPGGEPPPPPKFL